MKKDNQFKQYQTTARSLENGRTEVVYYKTLIVAFDKEEIVLDAGGWRTRTTMIRMNQVSRHFGLGYRVYQKDTQWFVEYKKEKHNFTDERVRVDRTSGEVTAAS
jgi:hypothetical protein